MEKTGIKLFLCCEKADLDGTVFLVSPKKFKSSVLVLFMPKQRVAFTVSEKEQALCLDISEPGFLTKAEIFFQCH